MIDLDSISKNTDKNVMKKHNFSAGPSILPRVAIENAAKAILDFNGMDHLRKKWELYQMDA